MRIVFQHWRDSCFSASTAFTEPLLLQSTMLCPETGFGEDVTRSGAKRQERQHLSRVAYDIGVCVSC